MFLILFISFLFLLPNHHVNVVAVIFLHVYFFSMRFLFKFLGLVAFFTVLPFEFCFIFEAHSSFVHMAALILLLAASSINVLLNTL